MFHGVKFLKSTQILLALAELASFKLNKHISIRKSWSKFTKVKQSSKSKSQKKKKKKKKKEKKTPKKWEGFVF